MAMLLVQNQNGDRPDQQVGDANQNQNQFALQGQAQHHKNNGQNLPLVPIGNQAGPQGMLVPGKHVHTLQALPPVPVSPRQVQPQGNRLALQPLQPPQDPNQANVMPYAARRGYGLPSTRRVTTEEVDPNEETLRARVAEFYQQLQHAYNERAKSVDARGTEVTARYERDCENIRSLITQ